MKKLIIILIAILLVAVGCSKGSDGGSYQVEMEAPDSGVLYDRAEAAPAFRDMSNLTGETRDRELKAAGDPAESARVQTEERKLVKRANVSVRVENLEAADASVSQLMEKYEAYAASTIANENRYSYSLKVPAHFYDLFLADMSGLGRLQNRHETTEDVTLRYYDLEGRLATKRELLKTFQAYLGKATNIDEIMKVEARISELQYDIDSTGKQLRTLANSVDYATIDLNLLGPATAKSYKGPTLGERVKRLFNSFGLFLSSLVVIFIGFIVFGIPILLILGLLFWVLFGRIGLIRRFWRLVGAKKGD
jgi:hypothetical protein